MAADNQLRGRCPPTERIRDRRGAVQLRTEQQLAVGKAHASGGRPCHLASEGRSGKALALRSILEAHLRRVGEEPRVSRHHQSRVHPSLSVPREVLPAARRKIHLRAESQRGDPSVLTDEAQVGSEAQVAHRLGARRLEGDVASSAAARAGLVGEERGSRRGERRAGAARWPRALDRTDPRRRRAACTSSPPLPRMPAAPGLENRAIRGRTTRCRARRGRIDRGRIPFARAARERPWIRERQPARRRGKQRTFG